MWWLSEKWLLFWGGKKSPSLRTFSVWEIEMVWIMNFYFYFFFFNWTFMTRVQVTSFLKR